MLPPLVDSLILGITPHPHLITGWANLLLMGQVSESLTGRASYLTRWPMTRRDQLGFGRGGIWEELLKARDEERLDLVVAQSDEPEGWRTLALRDGFPPRALHLKTAQDRTVWFDGYVLTHLERDLQDLSSISALADFRWLMRAAYLRMDNLVNQAELGRDVALPQGLQPHTHVG